MLLEKGWTKKQVYLFFLTFYLVCLPLNAMNLGAIGSALKLLAVFPILVAFLGEGKMVLNAPLIWQFAFTALAAISSFWSMSLSASFERVISYLLLFLLLLSASIFQFDKKDLHKIKLALVWGSRLTAVVLLVFGVYQEGRLRLSGIIAEDPNYICAYFAFGVIFAVQCLIDKNNLWRKVIALGELILYVFVILSTGSRGGTIAILVAILVFLVTSTNKNGALWKKIIILVAMLAAIVILMGFLSADLLERFTMENIEETNGANRFDIWANGWDLYSHASPLRQLFGFGTASIRECFRVFNYRPVNVMHNIYFETLVELGIVGFLVYMTAIGLFVWYAFKLKDKFSLAVISYMLIMGLSTSIYTFKPYFHIMLYIVMCTNIKREKKKKVATEEIVFSGDEL